MVATNKLERGCTLTRILDAPRDVVFQAWTEPEHLQWFFNNERPTPPDPIVVELRVGDAWRLKMVINDNLQYFTGGIYREIVPGEKLVFTWGAAAGWPEIDQDHPDDGPVVTVTLNELGESGEKTEMIFQLALPDHMPDGRVHEWLA
ncbi:MAG TPA: SRPBCC domain-containing protein, partial [Ktedonobacterales bacterium]|nr:SRPBCC domain-containing protein [Ktedonobacterales bacterium]